MYDKTDMRYKYQNDSMFKSLVDYMESFIQKGDFTPSEIREASMLASIHYEMSAPRRDYMPSAGIEIALDKFHQAVDKKLRGESDEGDECHDLTYHEWDGDWDGDTGDD